MDASPVHQVWLKTTLQGTGKGGRRRGRQKQRWEDNIREWTGLEFGKSQRAEENREKKMEETGREVIYVAPTTPCCQEIGEGEGLRKPLQTWTMLWVPFAPRWTAEILQS